MATTFSITYDNRGKLGSAPQFNPDSDRNGLWIEGSDSPGGESGGIFMNGNVTCIWSPGDNDLLRILDEDSFPTGGAPVFTIQNGGRILHRGTQIHADYVFESDYELESIEEHAAFMMKEKHLSAVPKAERDAHGNDIVEYGSLMRGLLEELEKAHLYIAKISDVVKEQREALSQLSRQVESLATSS